MVGIFSHLQRRRMGAWNLTTMRGVIEDGRICGRDFVSFFFLFFAGGGSLGDLFVVCTMLESEDGATHGSCMVVLNTWSILAPTSDST